MYFKRFYGSGYSEDPDCLKKMYDPRDKVWAEYICAVCGHTDHMDVTRTWDTTFKPRERRCPSCGCLAPEDKLKQLTAELEQLTMEKSRIQVQIDRVEQKISEASVCSN